jgi:hypothetical protein
MFIGRAQLLRERRVCSFADRLALERPREGLGMIAYRRDSRGGDYLFMVIEEHSG